jgi:hypothetical protein
MSEATLLFGAFAFGVTAYTAAYMSYQWTVSHICRHLWMFDGGEKKSRLEIVEEENRRLKLVTEYTLRELKDVWKQFDKIKGTKVWIVENANKIP